MPSDWLFLGLLFLVGLTGFALDVAVYLLQSGGWGYAVFLIHVVLAMELLALSPITKFAHALYRPLAYGICRHRRAANGSAVATGLAEAE